MTIHLVHQDERRNDNRWVLTVYEVVDIVQTQEKVFRAYCHINPITANRFT